MGFFQNTGEFLRHFNNLEGVGFFDPIPLKDTKVGFSIKRNYPDNIRYKPAIGQKSKKPDNVAALWVVYSHPEKSRSKVVESSVPIRIRISNMSLYTQKHWEHNPEDIEGDSPSEESIKASQATPKPAELEYTNEFFFDHVRNVFLDGNKKIVLGVDILDRVFKDHCNTVHLLKGLKLRVKLLARDKFAGFLGLIIHALVWCLKNLFGRTLEDNEFMNVFRGYKPEEMKKLDADSLDIFGYKASKPVIVLFCALMVSAAIYRYSVGEQNNYFSWVAGNEFLLLVHGILVIWLLDSMVPWVIFWVINKIIWVRTTISFMQIKGP